METLIDYRFNALSVANPDGTLPTSFTNASTVSGPGRTVLGDYPEALDLGTSGKAVCSLGRVRPNTQQFCINLIFNASRKITTRQNLVESGYLPFAIYLTSGTTPDKFNLVTHVKPKVHDWNGPDTHFRNELNLNEWYSISLVYDYDTVALFINRNLISVHAFPKGAIILGPEKKIYFGTWLDGIKYQFKGQLAAFQLYDGIPEHLESQLDARRNHAEWFITYKSEIFRQIFNMGTRTEGLKFIASTGVTVQHYQRCAIMYHRIPGIAYEIHGAIYEKYKSMPNPSILGYLISDELDTNRRNGKKSLFSQGGIYWSSANGAHPVTGQIYVEYENTDESRAWGFPINDPLGIRGGIEQIFQGCRFYYQNAAPKAHEVHGAILEKFLATGGIAKWGFPVSNESDVKRGSTILGKYSEFEKCTIYWRGGVGAFEVHGDIRTKYTEIGGPLSSLGFPTSDESNVPGVAGARANTFQQGSILWYGSSDFMFVARPFKIRIGRLDTKETEGLGMGQNDLYFNTIRLTQDTTVVHSERRPRSGSWSGKNVVNVDHTIPVLITPNKLNMKLKFFVDIWEDDGGAPLGGGDDHIGNYEKELNAANAWGLRESNGLYNAKFSKVNSLTWTVKPEVDINSLSETEKWWGPNNINTGTNRISYSQYASAFKGVDSEGEYWDITDGFEALFYELVVKGIADGGNCFGMSLEGINTRKGSSIISMPINRFAWHEVVNEFNIKQTYQVGANPIWWFLGQFLTGNTHNPVDVFNETQREFNRGNNPVLCVAQNWDFSGAPHCVLPVKWDKSSKPWKITINDPNGPPGAILTVNPDNNSFSYQRTPSTKLYRGGQWSGGRMHYMPYSLLCGKQRLIVWDLLRLLLSGTILILADDGETVSITDTQGNDLNAYGDRANKLKKEGKSISELFAGYNGFDSAIKPGQILMRREDKINPAKQVAIATADPEKVSAALESKNFIHTIKGKKNGKLNYYAKSGLTTIKLECALNLNETHNIELLNLGSNFCNLKMNSARSKKVKLEIYNQLGVNGDFQKISINNFPVGAGKNLDINIKQGIAGIEILNTGARFNLNVNIQSSINKVQFNKDYKIDLDKGIRLMPASLIFDKVLQVSPINQMFKESLGTFRI